MHDLQMNMPRPIRPWVLLALVASVALLLGGIDWWHLHRATNETGDSAANGLLIQDAKGLRLTVGNYSRLGFNHPGPAILYVLAAGEWLFHDVLHLASSAVLGQALAVAVYAAGWIVTCFALLRRISGSPARAALAVGVFLVATACWNDGMLVGLWFPQLYYLPFAVVVLALARLVAGRYDALVPGAVSAGFLIDGHASFLAIVGVMAVAVVAINAATCRTRCPERWLLDRQRLVAERATIGVAGAIVVAFLVPLAVETAIHFPGPLADYVRFGGRHGRNDPAASLRFVRLFWTPWAKGAAFIVALLLVRALRDAHAVIAPWRSLIAVLGVATVAVFLYAMFGVDRTSEAYIGYFYATVPAFTVMVGVDVAWTRWRRGGDAALTWVAASCLAVVALWLVRPPAGDVAPVATRIPAFDAAVERLRDGGPRLVFDLDERARYAEVWPFMAGVAVHEKRQRRQPFCIDRGWHILFTKALRCAAPDLKDGRRYRVERSVDGAQRGAPAVIDEAGIGVFAEAADGAAR